jgi:glutamate transport system permease protein
MTAVVLADQLGPRGRRRVRIATWLATALIGFLLVVAVGRLRDKGQLTWEKWEPLTQWSVLKFLLLGLGATVRAGIAGMAIAVVLGGVLALARLSRTAALRWLATAWVEFFRGFPLILLILFSYIGVRRQGFDITPFRALVLALALYNGAMLGEIFRAGILSLARGQTEAAYAIGLSYWQTMFLVVIPQAARRMTPAIVSQLVTLLKDTSLGYVITYEELLRRSRSTGEYFHNPLQVTVFVAVVYIVVNFALSRVAQRLEARQQRRLGASSIGAAGAEDLAAVSAAAAPA